MASDFAGIIGVLAGAKVDFVIIGGLAAQAHGSARLTQDADFIYGRSPDNLTRLAGALEPYRPYLRGAPRGLPFVFNAATIERGLNFTLTSTLGDIDFLGEMMGGGKYEEVRPHTDMLVVFGHEVRVLNLPALIRAKRAAGRPKDLEVLSELEALLIERELSVRG